MSPVIDLAELFLESFDKSGVELFKNWLAEQPADMRWIIGADFALRDKSRPGDCFAFSIISYDKSLDEFEREVRQNLPRDLKDTKTLLPTEAAWLSDKRHFHFVMPVNRDRVFFGGGSPARERDAARAALAATANHFVAADRHPDQIRRIQQAVYKSNANSFRAGLFLDICLLAILLPLVTLVICRERKVKSVDWFCDRDSMTNWADGVVWDLAMENLAGLAEHFAIDTNALVPKIAVPTKLDGQEVMWYDHYCRSADWLAGTMAQWDRSPSKSMDDKNKYDNMILNVVADSKNAVFLQLRLKEDGFAVYRLDMRREQG